MGWYGGDGPAWCGSRGRCAGTGSARPARTGGTNTVQTELGALPDRADPTTGRRAPTCCGWTPRQARSGSSRSPSGRPASQGQDGHQERRQPGRPTTPGAATTWYNGPGGRRRLQQPLAGGQPGPALRPERRLRVPAFTSGTSIQLAERLGMPLAYASSMDIASRPAPARYGASALFSLGHDEYWSPPERANVHRGQGTPARTSRSWARTAASGGPGWPARRLGADRLVICYKTSYHAGSGVREGQRAGHQRLAGAADTRDPESSLTGTLYESNPTDAAYVVASPDAWMFAGTGVQEGHQFPGLVGIEYDRVNPGAPVGAADRGPVPLPADLPRGEQLLDSAYYTHSSGAGVFNTGTMRWVGAFDPAQYRSYGVTTGQGLRPARHGQRAAGLRRWPGREQVPGTRQPGRHARVGRRPDRRPAQPLAPDPPLTRFGGLTTARAWRLRIVDQDLTIATLSNHAPEPDHGFEQAS